jgi:hypothetical protein
MKEQGFSSWVYYNAFSQMAVIHEENSAVQAFAFDCLERLLEDPGAETDESICTVPFSCVLLLSGTIV